MTPKIGEKVWVGGATGQPELKEVVAYDAADNLVVEAIRDAPEWNERITAAAPRVGSRSLVAAELGV
jgi:hypothetical protein